MYSCAIKRGRVGDRQVRMRTRTGIGSRHAGEIERRRQASPLIGGSQRPEDGATDDDVEQYTYMEYNLGIFLLTFFDGKKHYSFDECIFGENFTISKQIECFQ